MDLRLFSPPLTFMDKLSVVDVSEVKAEARVTHDHEDALIGDNIETAYDYLSGRVGWLLRCCLLVEEFELYIPSWEPVCDPVRGYPSIELPMRPYMSLSSFESLQPDGSYIAVPTESFSVTDEADQFARLYRRGRWPYAAGLHPQAYRVRFTAGFGTTKASIPSPLRKSIRMLASEMYKNREASVDKLQPLALYGLVRLAGAYRLAKDHS